MKRRQIPGDDGILDEYRPGRKVKEVEIWRPSVSNIVSLARNNPQVVFKIQTRVRGKIRVRRMVNYIDKKGALEIENEQGIILSGKDDKDQLIDDWQDDFGQRKNGSDAFHFIISYPSWVRPEQAHDISRRFLADEYHNHEYVFSLHTDTNSPHVHAVVKTTGIDGKRLDPRKDDIKRSRAKIAEYAKEKNIFLDHSPRYARGKFKEKSDQTFWMRKRGETPNRDKKLVTAVAGANGDISYTDSEKKQTEIINLSRIEILHTAEEMKTNADKLNDPVKRKKLLDESDNIRSYVDRMKKPQTEKERLNDVIQNRKEKTLDERER